MKLPLLFCISALVWAQSPPLLGQISIRVGLETKATECLFSLEAGGQVCTREGQPILVLAAEEKVRIWFDHRGEADPSDGYRVQVGGPMALAAAEALIQHLRGLGMPAPERVKVNDGNTWRVLTGWFDRPPEAEPLVAKLGAAGLEELWIGSEKRDLPKRKGRALYAITERYERIPLPLEGVSFRPRGEWVQVHGKGRYRGRMETFPNAQGRLTVVNTVELETYLRGVVPKEMGAWEFPALEALKAQAVAARTYAVANRGKRAKEGFDLLDTVADQVYGGRDGEQSLTDAAIEETRGLVATYGGQPIQALFMANSGGATVDNVHVFGGGSTPYLKSATNYALRPTRLPFRGVWSPAGDQRWLNLELLRLAAAGALSWETLEASRLARLAAVEDLRGPLATLGRRLHLGAAAPPATEQAAALLLWMARSLGFQEATQGQERVQDGAYFLGEGSLAEADLVLAGFLTRRGLVAPTLWKAPRLSLSEALTILGKLWAELEPWELKEGTLLRDGQVRVKNGGPGPLPLAASVLLAEEAPGGSLRLVTESAAQVGDRLRWMSQEGGSPLLIRRLDPDGASLDRYNPTAHWKSELKESDLRDRLKERGGIRGLRDLELKYNEHGRVLELVVRDTAGKAHRFTGMRIRALLGLKDNVFRLVRVGQAPERRWIVYGRGWGHGVGMDQTGAYGWALEGWTYDRILKHYFQGIELQQMK